MNPNKLFKFSLLTTMVLLLVLGCKKDKKNIKDDPQHPAEVELAENVIVIDDDANENLKEVEEDKVVYIGSNTDLDKIKEGTIIISGITENAPEGYLRKVTSVQKNGQEYTFITEEVALNEAFENLDVDYTYTVGDESKEGGRVANGINIPLANLILYDADGNSNTTVDQLRFSGLINIQPQIDVKIRIKKFKVEYIYIGSNLQTSIDLNTVFGGAVAGISKSIKIYEQVLGAFMIPGTPIVITPTISVVLGADGSISAELNYAQTISGNVGAYVQYVSGQASADTRKDLDINSNFSGFAGSVGVKAYLSPSLNFKFFGSDWAKASINTEIYAGINAQMAPYKPCELKAGLSGGVSANLGFFGKQIATVNYPDILDFSKSLYTCSATPPTNSHLNPNLTYGTVSDIEGNKYATIQIGNQVWMAENLRTTRFNNGDPIPEVRDSVEWKNLKNQGYKYAWCYYNNDASYNETHGKIYNGYAVFDPRNICPTGWHVPTWSEWNNLGVYLGTNAFGKLKSVTGGWFSPNTGATNESGFSAIPSGTRRSSGKFENIGSHMYLLNGENGYRSIVYNKGNSGGGGTGPLDGINGSCRCIKD